jgi:hypothetical protein
MGWRNPTCVREGRFTDTRDSGGLKRYRELVIVGKLQREV